MNTQQNPEAGPAVEPPSERPDLQVTAEASVAEASAGVTKVNPKLAQHLDQVSPDRAGIATNATEGLSSILSNLEGIVKIADLLADVSAGSHPSPLHLELILLNSYW